MSRETSHSISGEEYFCFRNNFLACFGPGASSIMEIFLISLTARFVSGDTSGKYSLLDLPFLSFQQMEATSAEPLSENSFRFGMHEWIFWMGLENVNQNEY